MTIDTSGQWWVGTEAVDAEAYVRALEAEGHTVHETRLCKCDCGSLEFTLEADRDEGCARRKCCHCGAHHFICDSAEYWDEAASETCACAVCGRSHFNLAVGFSLYEADEREDRDVRWVSVGNRCLTCGTLGSFIDWKVGYGDSYQLLDQA
jgi:hypothetical protein